MKVKQTFSLSITMKEFRQYANPLVDQSALKREIKDELYHSIYGIWDGDFIVDDWKQVFFYQLFKRGVIKQTEKCIKDFGLFEH